MLSFFVPWHALFASTHFVAFTCQMDFVAKAPCVLALLVQGAKAGALLDRVPCFMRGDVPKWCHSSKSFFFLFFSLFQNLLEKKLRSKARSPTSTPNQQRRPQGRMHLWSWIMKHVWNIPDFGFTFLTLWTRIYVFDPFFGLVFDWNFRYSD